MRMIHREDPAVPWSIETTLLELVTAVQDASRSDDEVVSVVSRLVNSGRVVLRGIFAGATLPPGGGEPPVGTRRRQE